MIIALIGLLFVVLAVALSSLHVALNYASKIHRVVSSSLEDARIATQDTVARSLAESQEKIVDTLNQAVEEQAGAEALTSAIREVGSIAHDLQSAGPRINAAREPRSQAREKLYGALERFARVFTQLSGHEMRACLKIITTVETRGRSRRVAVTFARSTTVVEDPEDRLNPINDNTDFRAISLGLRTWHSNFISGEADYQNSSPNRKYESAFVWGIRDVVRTQESESLIGFLCLDSVDPEAIDERRDAVLGWWMVDAILALYTGAKDDAFKVRPPALPG